MAKGKKTIIKEIKKIDDETIQINGREYVIIEDTKDIQTATTMKISSNGNRILRFEDPKKKATIDVKRDISIIKYTIPDTFRGKRFQKSFDRSILTKQDKIEIAAKASSFLKAKQIISSYTSRESLEYDKHANTTTFYQVKENK
jgi:hypothetical protein